MLSPFVLPFVVHSFAYEKRVKERRGGGGRQEEKKKEKEKTCAESAPRILSLCSFEREKNQNIQIEIARTMRFYDCARLHEETPRVEILENIKN